MKQVCLILVHSASPLQHASDGRKPRLLSDSERELILEVLRRDEELRQAENQRIRKLKSDLQDIKRRGAKRGSGKYSQRVCGRCLQPLSRLSVFSSQCRMCHHYVCHGCRTPDGPKGSWLCCVCAMESDLKKRTGDWFYDQRVNRFSESPGHDLVRSSIKKPAPIKKRETISEVLLKSTEVIVEPPAPIPRAKLKQEVTNKSSEKPVSITSRESFESREDVHSDTESAEITLQRTATESHHVTPEVPRKASQPPQSILPESSLQLPLRIDITDHSLKSEDESIQESRFPLETDVDRLFKKSVKRAHRTSEFNSTLDLRDEPDSPPASLASRSKSVPGLDIAEEEEDEDIDSLVSFHKRNMASSTSSLNSSKSTLGSLMSIYSEAGDYDSVEVSGELVFSIRFDENTQSLLVFIKECRGLAYGESSRQQSNPYVKCYLLPEKSRQSKRKTSIKRHTVNPIFNETLKYSISRSQLFSRSVLISVWHHGRFSRNTFLGEVEIALDCRDLDSPTEETIALMSKLPSSTPAFPQYKGELIISLKYVAPKTQTPAQLKSKKTDEGELQVLIKEAKNLVAIKLGDTADSFVKGYLFPTKGKSTKRKTPVVKKNLNPHFDHTFVYKDVNLEQLKEMCLELTVWDKEAMSSNEFLGGVRLSCGKGTVKTGKEEVEMDSVGEEVSLWQKMMQYPDSWAEGTLLLRSTMGKSKEK
ncbi:hypothetical protein WMY93_009417 [Mugilogobius chulae]|uniref:Synaptotagmin-like protein 4 n=1 Tax=Mugilogobius chulae TaxID=88201 RepID=A0AAW0PKK8_9GOBI